MNIQANLGVPAGVDLTRFISSSLPDNHQLDLLVDGMHCASCGFLIEHTLAQQAGVTARVNVTEKRLALSWQGDKARAAHLIETIEKLGYRVTPYNNENRDITGKEETQHLMKCIAVSGFAMGNVMLFSFPIWGDGATMGVATRDILHGFSALIALPAILYAGQPFFKSAFNVLKALRTNMDVPISIGVLLATFLSFYQVVTHQAHAYFDSALMLLFFLLIGRYLDLKARGRARSAARDLLLMMAGHATLLENGQPRQIAIKDILPDMIIMVAAGEKIKADGYILDGSSDVDTSFLTGETLPRTFAKNDNVHAGMVNLTQPLTIKVSAAHNQNLISDIIRLMQEAEQAQGKFVRLADRVARAYTPVVHVLAAASFIGWYFFMGVAWQQALVIAISVLIITCPCALGLAVPVVQVLASNWLFTRGMLLKSADALERLTFVDTIIFDKTGTLTLGKPRLISAVTPVYSLAACMAQHSRHPLAKALVEAYQTVKTDEVLAVKEKAGEGLEAYYQGKMVRLGKRQFAASHVPASTDSYMELWFSGLDDTPVRFVFEDTKRPDALTEIAKLHQESYVIEILSGDREEVAKELAASLHIESVQGGLTPTAKHDYIKAKEAKGHKVLYVGDGLNDAAALSAATASLSPSTAMDISQNAAHLVFQGEGIFPVRAALHLAKTTQHFVKQNFAIALIYNLLAVPLAVMGFVTPMVAAIAMSTSSLMVIANALRLKGFRVRTH